MAEPRESQEPLDRRETVVFVHGLGESAEDWEVLIEALPEGFDGIVLDPFAATTVGPSGAGFELARSAEAIACELDRRGIGEAHICGLSLGAMVAFRFALDHPGRVRSITLAAGQVRPPRLLMALQLAVMRVLPERIMASGGTTKAQLLEAVRVVARTDFSGDLAGVAAPALVLCGSKDRANLPAARAFASGIPGAELRIVDGAGHQLQVQAPQAFAAVFGDFLARVSRDQSLPD